MAAVKAVIDTNVWVSALINPYGYPAQLREFFERGTFQAIISEPMLEELAEVLSRPRIKDKYGLSHDDIQELLVLIEERSEHVLLSGDVAICRDKDDNVVIETAIKGQAQYLVTRDDDIKCADKICSFLRTYGISVISVARFLDRVGP